MGRASRDAAVAASPADGGASDAAPSQLSVLVVDDHQSVAQSLAFVLAAEGLEASFVVPGSLDEVTARAAESLPDVVLLDLDLGAAVGAAIPVIGPLVSGGSLVVMLTGVQDRFRLAACVEAGAAGIVDKSAPFEELLTAVEGAVATGLAMDETERHVLLGELRTRREVERARLAPFALLTPKEEAVLIALCDGQSAAEYASAAFVSVFTVRGHIRSILTKLGVGSQLAAVAMARRSGWLA